MCFLKVDVPLAHFGMATASLAMAPQADNCSRPLQLQIDVVLLKVPDNQIDDAEVDQESRGDIP